MAFHHISLKHKEQLLFQSTPGPLNYLELMLLLQGDLFLRFPSDRPLTWIIYWLILMTFDAKTPDLKSSESPEQSTPSDSSHRQLMFLLGGREINLPGQYVACLSIMFMHFWQSWLQPHLHWWTFPCFSWFQLIPLWTFHCQYAVFCHSAAATVKPTLSSTDFKGTMFYRLLLDQKSRSNYQSVFLPCSALGNYHSVC